jgi:hypothetical protein
VLLVEVCSMLLLLRRRRWQHLHRLDSLLVGWVAGLAAVVSMHSRPVLRCLNCWRLRLSCLRHLVLWLPPQLLLLLLRVLRPSLAMVCA